MAGAGRHAHRTDAGAESRIAAWQYNSIVKTIAITIDEDMLAQVDRLSEKGRSRLIRDAIRSYLAQRERQMEERRESTIIRKHRARLARQARALVREQAKP
jgi:metal-responsive CopG/Arc/MetJ family transcriptional regulator